MMYIPRFQALDDLKADIAQRLRPLCTHFPDDEFAALIDQIARIEYKYARSAAGIVPRSHFSDTPITDQPNPSGGPSEISP